MVRSLLLLGCCVVLLGVNCQGFSALTCANELDGAKFGFTLTVPSRFTCAYVPPDPLTLALVGYVDDPAEVAVSVAVFVPEESEQTDGGDDNIEELPNLTNSQGVTFTRAKLTETSQGRAVYSYVGLAALQDGNTLLVSVGAYADDASLTETLNTILETVQIFAPTA